MQTTGDADVQLVADFVRRLRRVALHPLALDDQGGDDFPCLPGAYLRMLMTAGGTLLVRPDRSATMRSPLPDEVQFESLATCVRTFTIKSDRLCWPTALDALDRLTGLEDERVRSYSEKLRQHWTQATECNTPEARAYVAGYRIGKEGEAGQGHYTDLDLAYAWLYQAVAHGDPVSTGYFDVKERFRAAVGVFSHMAVAALDTCTMSISWWPMAFWIYPSAPSVTGCGDRPRVRPGGVLLRHRGGADLSVLDDDPSWSSRKHTSSATTN